jgi:hypothetical protein
VVLGMDGNLFMLKYILVHIYELNLDLPSFFIDFKQTQ